VDGTAPTVDSTVPANNATGVAVSSDVTATFAPNEKVNPATVSGSTVASPGTFKLEGPDTNADVDTNPDLIPGVVTFDTATRTAKLNPNADLAQNTTYTATLIGGASGIKDYAGNALASNYTWSFKTFNPNTEPVLTVPANITAEATGPAGAAVDFAVSATDAEDDPDPTPSCTRGTPPATVNSGATFALGTTTVNCSVTDSGGLSASGSFTVTVQDTTGPNFTNVPNNITQEATGPNGAAVTFTKPTATDLVDGSRTVTCDAASGDTFPLGTTTVHCSASDTRNNSSSASFDVTVRDTTAPAISGMPSNMSLTAASTAGAQATWTAPTATDLVDGNVSVNCTKGDPPVAVTSGDTFPVGTTTVTCKATDAHNNTASKSFTITVTYGWSNFLQPINLPDPTTGTFTTAYPQSVFKQGSTVPVKFKLTGASAGITDGTFYIKYVRTGSGDGAGEAEAISTSAATTGNLFRYDATAGQYIFNWNTKSVTFGNWDIKVYSDSDYKNLLGSVSVELKK
jgi:hypothetical protein